MRVWRQLALEAERDGSQGGQGGHLSTLQFIKVHLRFLPLRHFFGAMGRTKVKKAEAAQKKQQFLYPGGPIQVFTYPPLN